MTPKHTGKKYIACAVLAAALLAGGYLYMNAGALITRTAERIASGALGVPVGIGSIHVSLADKKVRVLTLRIGNPPGYRHPYALTAGEIDIGLRAASQTLVDFEDITVKDSVVYFEMTPRGSNLADLKTLAAGKKQKASPGSAEIRVIVQHMMVDASVIRPSVSLLGGDLPEIPMPAVTLTGIGKEGGARADTAVSQLLTQYLSAAQRAVADSGLLRRLPTADDAKKTLNDAGGKLKSLFR